MSFLELETISITQSLKHKKLFRKATLMLVLKSFFLIQQNTVTKGFGLTKTSHQGKPILGYTDTETVKLDFDDTTLDNVKYWAKRTMNWFKLGGYIILQSSKNSYHVVFNKTVSWTENVSVVSWTALQSQNKDLIKWCLMQGIKQSSTLRFSSKGKKKPPKILSTQGKQDKEIHNFLEYRKMTRKIQTIIENRKDTD